MAFWTGIQVWLTIGSIAISALGLLLVWMSLRQTRQAITNDREVGHAQVKAHISIDVETPIVRPDELLRHAFNIRNTGQSPVYKAKYAAGFNILPDPLPAGIGHLGGIQPDKDM